MTVPSIGLVIRACISDCSATSRFAVAASTRCWYATRSAAVAVFVVDCVALAPLAPLVPLGPAVLALGVSAVLGDGELVFADAVRSVVRCCTAVSSARCAEL